MNTVSQGSTNPVELRHTTDELMRDRYIVRVADTSSESDGYTYLYIGASKSVAEEFAHNAGMVMHA